MPAGASTKAGTSGCLSLLRLQKGCLWHSCLHTGETAHLGQLLCNQIPHGAGRGLAVPELDQEEPLEGRSFLG